MPTDGCPSGQQWKSSTCSCQCKNTKTCTSPQQWVPDICDCGCDPGKKIVYVSKAT